jgi:hypothetical protein
MQERSGGWTGGACHESGDTQTGLSVGAHTEPFSNVMGWTKPVYRTVTINNGQTTTATGICTPLSVPQ